MQILSNASLTSERAHEASSFAQSVKEAKKLEDELSATQVQLQAAESQRIESARIAEEAK